ncbi:putative lipid II flippase FtsW [Paenibacillus dokdonensis]|uniref:Probable peptidoglycan glycosyltransferase FtsW n=1 Tax=Paenibacillus dokdonensis TaxID=2567944 RepID=A0ABU6GUY9_9BACL|nr:putative lipid II flippase FtsW [Paenibacillus dokdonensis]MEC0243559.1 putative lipid II flippase FtsW [Paenibacillus dokdonensis]
MNQKKPQPKKRGTPDFQLLILTFLLVGFGLVMVFSASSSLTISSSKFNNDPLYFTKKQFVWAILGTFVMFVSMNIHYSKYKKLFVPLFIVTVAMLAIVPFTKSVNGARSWLGIAGLGIQPTELAKIAIILYLSALIVKKGERFRDLRTGYIPVMVIVGFVAGLIMMQPDLGSTLILVATSAIIIYAGGASLKHILASAALLILGASLVLGANYLIKSIAHSDEPQTQSSNYKMGRITAWIDPYQDEKGDGYNLIQSLTAIGNGQLTGTGFGKSIQKLNYIKNPYNDFIFPVMAEEFGFIGTSLFLLVYIYFIWRGIIIALRCTDPFGTLVGIGIMGLFAIQAFVNIGGVSQTIPLTGVTLPFISYGGTSLLIMMFAMGIMLSISRQSNQPVQQEVVKSVNIKRDYRRSV